MLFCNRDLGKEEGQANIADMAPTVLELFGIEAPRYMDGGTLIRAKA